MFHDTNWEAPLLRQALAGPCFYVGAVGSRNTHERRCAALREIGCPEHQITRVRGPVGLIPSMRDASMLAISALAEIVGEFHRRSLAAKRRTALILLAAGSGARFESGDKLLADLNGRTVLSYAAEKLEGEPLGARIAVTAPGQAARQDILRRHGWTIVENEDATTGQASSLRAGVRRIASDGAIEQVLILLADMPLIPDGHLEAMLEAMTPDVTAAMTAVGDVLCPPALFTRACFGELLELEGDRGAKAVFERQRRRRTIDIEPELALDIDGFSDLRRASQLL
jgi:xanthine dehydrogenase accessory factor